MNPLKTLVLLGSRNLYKNYIKLSGILLSILIAREKYIYAYYNVYIGIFFGIKFFFVFSTFTNANFVLER